MCTRPVGLLFLLVISIPYANAEDSKPPYTISEETTVVTEPVSDDGLIDYIEILSRRQRDGVTPENNSVVMFRRALGLRELSEDTIDEYFKQLGMEVPPKDGEYLVGTTDFVDSLDDSELPKGNGDQPDPRSLAFEQMGEASSRPWTRDEFPMTARWIDTNEKPLAFVVRGSLRRKYYSPLLPSDGLVLAILLPDAQNSRTLARLLSARAMLKLGEGDVEAAWQDVMACHRVARLVAQGSTLIDILVGIAIESIACQCDHQIAQAGLSAEQAKRFSNDLRRLGVVGGSADRIDAAERFMYLDGVGKVAVYGTDMLSAISGSEDTNVERSIQQAILNGFVDWDVVLRMGNETYDRIVKAGRLPTRIDRQPELDKFNAELDAMREDASQLNIATFLEGRAAVSKKFGMIMISLMVPAVTQVFEAEDRCTMRAALSHCAFALAAWRAEHGGYPEQLEQLAPEFLRNIPIDIYTGKPLIYRRSDSGYLLYGIGKNLQDDHGFTFGEGDATDDLVVRTPDEDRRIKAASEKWRSEQ